MGCLFGQGKQRVDAARLQRLATGFSNFTVSGLQETSLAGASPNGAPAGGPPAVGTAQEPVLSETAVAALKVVFSKDGSYAQEVRFQIPS